MLMLNKKSILTVLLVCVAFISYAQTNKFNTSIGTDLGLCGKFYKIVTPHVSVTYDITPKLTAGVRVEDAITLMKYQGVKTYDNHITFGGQIGYDICKVLIIKVQPRVIVGHTIGGGHNRGYTYYQGGIYLKKDEGSIRSEIGLGVRYNDYCSDINKDKAIFFISYGFVLK
jgi:hypothetical protein